MNHIGRNLKSTSKLIYILCGISNYLFMSWIFRAVKSRSRIIYCYLLFLKSRLGTDSLGWLSLNKKATNTDFMVKFTRATKQSLRFGTDTLQIHIQCNRLYLLLFEKFESKRF